MHLKSVLTVLVAAILTYHSIGAHNAAAATAGGDGINCIGTDRFNASLLPGQAICSASGRYAAGYQGTDGNLVVYDRQAPGGPAAIWSLTGNAGVAPASLDPQGRIVILNNCNLIYYSAANQIVWQTRTVNQGNSCFAVIQDDANFVLYADYPLNAQPLWSIQTGNIARDTITIAPQDDNFTWSGTDCTGNDTDGYRIYVGGYYGCVNPNNPQILVMINIGGPFLPATIPAAAPKPANTYEGSFPAKVGPNLIQATLQCSATAASIATPGYQVQCPTPIASVVRKRATRLAWNVDLLFRILPESLRQIF